MVDQDGDHFANELINFVHAGEHVTAHGSSSVLVLGNRSSRHHALGFLRGQQEDFADRLLMDALTYAAAVRQAPLALQFATAYDPLPDFHSGYKLFSRAVAKRVFLCTPQLAGCDEEAYYRHACEAVMTVEALLAGATLATVNRTALDEQPISAFANFDRRRLAADMMIWPCKRLGVPAVFVGQWLDNHLAALLLRTLAPQGRDELLAIRDLVRRAFDLPPATPNAIMPAVVCVERCRSAFQAESNSSLCSRILTIAAAISSISCGSAKSRFWFSQMASRQASSVAGQGVMRLKRLSSGGCRYSGRL